MWPEVDFRPRTSRGRQQVQARAQRRQGRTRRIDSLDAVGQGECRIPERRYWLEREGDHAHHALGGHPREPRRIDSDLPGFRPWFRWALVLELRCHFQRETTVRDRQSAVNPRAADPLQQRNGSSTVCVAGGGVDSPRVQIKNQA